MAKKKKLALPTAVRVVAYIRVSTDQQASEGHSIEAQKRHLELYAELHGLTIVAVEVDAGLSASTLDRPGLQRAFQCLESGSAEGLLVVKLDRLTRSLRDLNVLLDTYFSRFRLMSAGESIDTSSASGRLVLNILITISQWEREAASERTAAVMAHMKATGKFTGGFPPFGFSLDEEGGLVPDLAEQALAMRAKELRAEGMSLRGISKALGANKRTGGTFSAGQIARLVE